MRAFGGILANAKPGNNQSGSGAFVFSYKSPPFGFFLD
jgi:hypothetical protein